MTPEASRVFYEGISAMGLEGKISGEEKALAYLDAMLEKNRVMNLSAIRDPTAAVQLHALDSLAIFRCLDFGGKSVLDVGTGGGIPGAMIAACAQDARVAMLDSTAKKLEFVKESCEKLDIRADFHFGRAEELASGALRESFDIVTARAVASLPALCELCLPFVKPGGVFAAYKANAEDELINAQGAVKKLGGGEIRVFEYTIPGVDSARCIILIEKRSPTPAQYPRAWAKIKAKPL